MTDNRESTQISANEEVFSNPQAGALLEKN